MTWFTGLLSYFIVWLISLFLVLPFGVKPQRDPVPGTPESAPERPHILRRALATTALATILWGIMWLVIESGIVNLRDTT